MRQYHHTLEDPLRLTWTGSEFRVNKPNQGDQELISPGELRKANDRIKELEEELKELKGDQRQPSKEPPGISTVYLVEETCENKWHEQWTEIIGVFTSEGDAKAFKRFMETAPKKRNRFPDYDILEAPFNPQSSSKTNQP